MAENDGTENDEGTGGEGSESSESTENEALGAAGETALKRERERARKAERELKAATTRLKEFEDRNKTEAEKLAERASAAERAAADATSQLLRFQVAAEKGLPAELVARLQGSNAKELAADADKLLELFKGGGGGPPNFNGGPRKTAEGKTDMNALIRSTAGLG